MSKKHPISPDESEQKKAPAVLTKSFNGRSPMLRQKKKFNTVGRSDGANQRRKSQTPQDGGLRRVSTSIVTPQGQRNASSINSSPGSNRSPLTSSRSSSLFSSSNNSVQTRSRSGSMASSPIRNSRESSNRSSGVFDSPQASRTASNPENLLEITAASLRQEIQKRKQHDDLKEKEYQDYFKHADTEQGLIDDIRDFFKDYHSKRGHPGRSNKPTAKSIEAFALTCKDLKSLRTHLLQVATQLDSSINKSKEASFYPRLLYSFYQCDLSIDNAAHKNAGTAVASNCSN